MSNDEFIMLVIVVVSITLSSACAILTRWACHLGDDIDRLRTRLDKLEQPARKDTP